MKLRTLPPFQPLYFIPHDNFIGEVIIPCLRIADEFRCMLGFFSSESLREIAPGLAEFLHRQHTQMRLLISPYLSSEDQIALTEGTTTAVEILEKKLLDLFGEARISEIALVRHTLDCLAYLVAAQRLKIKITLIHKALFHPKVWIFDEVEDSLIAHGSVNMTSRGLTANYEHISIECSWLNSKQAAVVNRFVQEFKSLWSGSREDAFVIPLPEAIHKKLLYEYQPNFPPTHSSFLEAWQADFERGFTHPLPDSLKKTFVPTEKKEKTNFHVPEWLNYNEGDFAHQGKAVKAWLDNNGRGILEMATGSGKTIASLICAECIWNENQPLLLVISAPFLPLIYQWAEEARKFGLKPLIPGNETNKTAKLAQTEKAIRNLRLEISEIECIIVTHNFLCDPSFTAILNRFHGPSMLIADEVHNLGAKRFVESQYENFSFRLGLSATPVRQYDEAGTTKLKDYFGDIVFRFTLQEAIGKCLVPYYYFVRPATLTVDESEEWLELTEKLRKLGWTFSEAEASEASEMPLEVKMILNKRRRILEQAKNKMDVLYNVLSNTNLANLSHTLIYASDKGREQLKQVNALCMNTLKLRVHQITQAETSNPKLLKLLLNKFAEGKSIQVLTAMRVLDEGVDIPEISQAYILASTTVERQWIQRRGRVLRKCKRTNKKNAEIHDFLVLPPAEDGFGVMDADLLKIIKSELNRVMSFASLSLNAASSDGAISLVRSLMNQYFLK